MPQLAPIRLFLDDLRNPKDCVGYMHSRIGHRNPEYMAEWHIVRSFKQFCEFLNCPGVARRLTIVSFDHDLDVEHYGIDMTAEAWEEYHTIETRVPTGLDAAHHLIVWCYLHNRNLPEIFIHTANSAGHARIQKAFESIAYATKQRQ